jgi:uncharacterized repeat protein (TIGR03803 family)
MQHRRRRPSSFLHVALAVLVGIVGFASNTHGQTSYEVVAAFDGDFPLGARPNGALIQGSDGSFYGTTSESGAAGSGTIFKIDSAGTITTVHAFNGADGASPRAELIQANDGSFYGTTKSGGAAGYGTIFKVDGAGTLTSLHSFNSSDGANPYSG